MKIETNISLHDKNWFGTGGLAQFFTQPVDGHEFSDCLLYAQQHQLPVTILGQGANLLISDSGIAGLVIKPMISTLIVHDDATVTAGAGVIVHDLIEYCLANQLTGLEDFSGIPGSVGGSVFINIHYFEHLLSDFLIRATVINKTTGQLAVVDNAWFGFGYNESQLQSGEWFLIDATLQLVKVSSLEAAFAQGRRAEIIRHRERRYPSARTCGSFFRNFLDHEVSFLTNGKKVLNVGYYLEKVGVKGVLRVGNAIVTHQHSNMLVTLPEATSADVIGLARAMQDKVYEAYGIMPQAECQFLGFEQDPLAR